jgi:tetratricopeptide (TPR) repeat protein
VRSAQERVRREPRSVEAWGLLGQVLLANGFSDDADPCLAHAEALDPDSPRWPYLRAYGATRDREAAFGAAKRAISVCERTGRVEPAPYLFLAELHMERGERDQAEALCRRVVEAEPNNARARLDLGLLALEGNDAAVAVSHLLRAAQSPTARQTAATQLAAAYQRRGDDTAAADWARRARQTPPDDPWPDPYVEPMQELVTGRHVRQRQVERLEAQGRLREAVALLRKMTADDPTDDHSLVVLGAMLTRTGDFAGAEQALRRAAALAPKAVDPTYFLAVALFKQGERLEEAGEKERAAGKFQAAADAALRATEIKPDHAQAHGFLGLALKRLGRRKEAIESFRVALRCWPEDADGHLALGEALLEDGQKAEALTELKYAFDLAGPDDPRFRQALERARADQRPRSWLWP